MGPFATPVFDFGIFGGHTGYNVGMSDRERFLAFVQDAGFTERRH
jgi:hypothetical protein